MTEETWTRPGVAYWMSKRVLHFAFLAFFVLFLVVGVALTVLGFLDYGGHGGPLTRAFRILGVVALLLCIGFLIAACVIVSECITASIKRGTTLSETECEGVYGYRLMYPTSSETIATSAASDFDPNTMVTTSGTNLSAIIPNPIAVLRDENDELRNRTIAGAQSLGLCPSCSCQLIARPVGIRANVSQSVSYPNGIVQFQKARDSAIIHLANDETDMLMREMAPAPPSIPSDRESSNGSETEGTEPSPRDWV